MELLLNTLETACGSCARAFRFNVAMRSDLRRCRLTKAPGLAVGRKNFYSGVGSLLSEDWILIRLASLSQEEPEPAISLFAGRDRHHLAGAGSRNLREIYAGRAQVS